MRRYSFNDPVNDVDPTGTSATVAICATVILVGGGAYAVSTMGPPIERRDSTRLEATDPEALRNGNNRESMEDFQDARQSVNNRAKGAKAALDASGRASSHGSSLITDAYNYWFGDNGDSGGSCQPQQQDCQGQ
jgi:hypothetical protein